MINFHPLVSTMTLNWKPTPAASALFGSRTANKASIAHVQAASRWIAPVGNRHRSDTPGSAECAVMPSKPMSFEPCAQNLKVPLMPNVRGIPYVASIWLPPPSSTAKVSACWANK